MKAMYQSAAEAEERIGTFFPELKPYDHKTKKGYEIQSLGSGTYGFAVDGTSLLTASWANPFDQIVSHIRFARDMVRYAKKP